MQKRESAINFADYRASQEGHAFQDVRALKKFTPRETGRWGNLVVLGMRRRVRAPGRERKLGVEKFIMHLNGYGKRRKENFGV